jgi:hypothetical protein
MVAPRLVVGDVVSGRYSARFKLHYGGNVRNRTRKSKKGAGADGVRLESLTYGLAAKPFMGDSRGPVAL